MKKTRKVILMGVLFLLTAGISVYMAVGFSTIMMADDYCYFSFLKQNKNFLDVMIKMFTQANVIAGNRFSANLFSVSAGLFGDTIIRLSPALNITGLLFALYFLFDQIVQLWLDKKEHIYAAVMAALFTGILVYIAPSRFQSIYWFSGAVAYTVPLIFYVFLLGTFLKSLRVNRPSFLYYAGMFLLAFAASGFSETSATTFLVQTGFILIFLAIDKRIDLKQFRHYLPIIGILLGIFLQVISPSANARNADQDTVMVNGFIRAANILSTAFVYGADFIVDQFKSFVLPVFVFLAGAISIGGLLEFSKLSFRKFVSTCVLTVISTYVVISASTAPQIFAFGTYPNERSLMVPAFFLLLGMGIFGGTTGAYLSVLFTKYRRYLVIPLLLAAVYVLRSGYLELDVKQEFQTRRNAWEIRNSYLIQSVADGEEMMTIETIGKYDKIWDFNPVCFAPYYGLKSVEMTDKDL